MLPAGLSMLWEPDDPGEALTTRFGFADLAAATRWLTATLASTWGIEVRGCDRLVISDVNVIAWARTDRGELIVKWCVEPRRFDSLQRSTSLLRHLHTRGVPVAGPVPTPDGQVRVVVPGPAGELSVGVLPEIAGDWLDVTDPDAVRDAGGVLARLHAALATHPDRDTVRIEPEPLGPRVAVWLHDRDHGLAPAASARLAALVDGLPEPRGGHQPVQNDYRAANLLTRDSQVVAVLDFDDIAWEHPLNDLARASVLLATLFTDWPPTSAAVRRRLREGYAAVRPLDDLDERWLDVLVRWHLLAMIPAAREPQAWLAAVEEVALPD